MIYWYLTIDPSISDNQGELRDIDEIIARLSEYYKSLPTQAMSDYKLILMGRKEMLGGVIDYLKRVVGKEDPR